MFEKIDTFSTKRKLDRKLLFYVDENRISQLKEVYSKNHATGLICKGSGLSFYKTQNLNFLKHFPNIEELQIIMTRLEDYEGLKNLKNLKRLVISNNLTKPPLNLAYCSGIEELQIDWHAKIINTHQCNLLEKVILMSYHSKKKSLEDFPFVNSIKELTITRSNIHALKGINALHQLKNLSLIDCKKLENIEELASLKQLEKLIIDTSSKSIDYQNIKKNSNLRELEISGGKLENLNFLNQFPRLSSLILSNTTIKDGDLSILSLRNWDHLYFKDHSSYTHKLNELL